MTKALASQQAAPGSTPRLLRLGNKIHLWQLPNYYAVGWLETIIELSEVPGGYFLLLRGEDNHVRYFKMGPADLVEELK